MLILFGAGDGGGIFIGPDGRVHRLPSWNAAARRQLAAANELIKLTNVIDEEYLRAETNAIAESLATGVVPQVIEELGIPSASASCVVFVDGEDGFVCASTGKLRLHTSIPAGLSRNPDSHSLVARV